MNVVPVKIDQDGGGLPPEARAELTAAMQRMRRGRGLLVRLADMAAGAVTTAGAVAVRALTRAAGRAVAGAEGAGGRADRARRARSRSPSLGLRPGAPPGAQSRAARIISRAAVGFLRGRGRVSGDGGIVAGPHLHHARDHARGWRGSRFAKGEDSTTEELRAACLAVFSLMPAPGEWTDERMDENELSYFSARMLLQGRTVMALVEQVGARYGLVLSRKLALQAVPIVGAATGAALNDAFLRHALDLAEGHFVIRRLERRNGSEAVRAAAAAAAG